MRAVSCAKQGLSRRRTTAKRRNMTILQTQIRSGRIIDATHKKTPARAEGFLRRDRNEDELVFARTCRGTLLLCLQVFFEELHQAVNQPTPAADHVQAALVLVFLEDVVQLVFELTHRMISQR